MNARQLCLAAGGLLATGLAFAGARVAIVNESSLAGKWALAPDQPRLVAGYPSNAPDQKLDVCVVIGYEVGADGTTSEFSELNSWNSAATDDKSKGQDIGPYTQIAAAVVKRRKYVAVEKAKPVFTSATFAFNGSKTQDDAAIQARCQIADLNDFIAKIRDQSQDKGNLDTEALRRRRDLQEQSVRPSNSPTGRY